MTALVYPVIPESAAKIWAQLGFRTPLDAIRTADLDWGKLAPGRRSNQQVAYFQGLT